MIHWTSVHTNIQTVTNTDKQSQIQTNSHNTDKQSQIQTNIHKLRQLITYTTTMLQKHTTMLQKHTTMLQKQTTSYKNR